VIAAIGRAAGVALVLVALAGAAAAQAPAATPTPQPPPSGAASAPVDSALERRLIQIASNLRCPVCQNLSILDSPSELAQDMKRLVRDQLVQGRSKEEIEQYFIARYGEWVLLKPAAHGATLTVWVLPAVMLLGGALLVWFAVRRWTRPVGAPVAEAAVAAPVVVSGTPAELISRRDALRRILAELDEDFAEGKVTQEDYESLRRHDEAELAAVRTALKQSKSAERKPAPVAAGKAAGRRLHPALAWTGGVVVFGIAAAVSLSGALRARGQDDSITGLQFGDTSSGGAVAPGSDIDPAQLAALEARVARDSNDYPALLEVGHLYLRMQRLKPAADVSMRAVQLRPRAKETSEAFAHLGMILWSADEIDAGLQSLEQALRLSPDLPEALLYKGIILFAGANNPREAIKAWERYLEVAPPGAETARVRAMLQGARQAVGERQ
jgi:cytochrome c-type biogenesis protein CcmH